MNSDTVHVYIHDSTTRSRCLTWRVYFVRIKCF